MFILSRTIVRQGISVVLAMAVDVVYCDRLTSDRPLRGPIRVLTSRSRIYDLVDPVPATCSCGGEKSSSFTALDR
jgi:hypothetical protein